MNKGFNLFLYLNSFVMRNEIHLSEYMESKCACFVDYSTEHLRALFRTPLVV